MSAIIHKLLLHKWELLPQPNPYGREDYATHQCSGCGKLIDRSVIAPWVLSAEPCSGLHGVYSYMDKYADPPSRLSELYRQPSSEEMRRQS
jgi:hypothetical protein